MNIVTLFRRIFFVVIIIKLSVFSFAKPLKRCNITIINSINQKKVITVDLAVSKKDQTRGLMYRKEMNENYGMLFVYKKELFLVFWMKNTYIPLSIAYINKNGFIVDIKDMKPLDTSVVYPSDRKALYALEVNQGWFKKNLIKVGDKIKINHGCIGK